MGKTASEPSQREGRIFAAAAGAMVGREADERELATAAAPFLAPMSRGDRLLLKLFLFALEFSAPLSCGRVRRFTRLSLADRAKCLASWSHSRLKLRRQGVQALKVLAMLSYYGREEAWPQTGYGGPWLGRKDIAVLPAPDLRPQTTPGPAASIHRAGDLPAGVTAAGALGGDLRLRAEALVIGTGAGGAAVAARLAEGGMDVLAIEAGAYHPASDFTQRELEMLPMLFAEAGLRATQDKAVGILQGTGVGGSTLHNTCLTVPAPDGILGLWREEHGFAFDEATMRRHFAEVMQALGAAPIPESQINANNDVLRRGAGLNGWRYQIPHHNRSECCECGYCVLGCAYNRKNHAGLTFVPRAVAAGARILAGAAASRLVRRHGAWQTECDLLDASGRPSGRRAWIGSERVILCCGALDTPALLRRSGIGNRNVGGSLRLHPSPFVAAIFPHEIRAWRGLPQSVLVDEFASFFENGRGGFLLLALAGWPGLGGAMAPGLGKPHAELMRLWPRVASAVVLLHDQTAGTVSFAGDGRPRASYWPSAADLEEMHRGIGALAKIFLDAGALEVRLPYTAAPAARSEDEIGRILSRAQPGPHRLILNSVHPQASCPMGVDSRRAAVRPNGEVWDAPGLFVCDASIFPSSVGVPPQVTVMALASAIGERMLSAGG